ncbi:MAG: VOC family protein [Opitutae bacterium]|nr:VOC family protein [Opitutae bacterium]
MKIRGVDFILHPVGAIAPAVAFYRDVLGLRLETYGEPERWAEFDCGNVTLVLQGGAASAPAASRAKLALAVDDIDAAHARLIACGATVLQAPQDYGVCRAFEIRDPDGNTILLHRRADGTFGSAPPPPPS